MKNEQSMALDRRGFLRSVAGVGAAGAGIAGGMAAPVQAAESDSEKRKSRYQEKAADVQAYYRVNRY